MRVPLEEVMSWPDHHVMLQLAFLAKEPPAEERIEHAVASLAALTYNLNVARGAAPRTAADFLMAPDPWTPPKPVGNALSAAEMQFIARIPKHAKPQPV